MYTTTPPPSMAVASHMQEHIKYCNEINQKPEDIKTKGLVHKIFNWLWQNKVEVTLVLAALTIIPIIIPLTTAGIILSSEAMPILFTAAFITTFFLLKLITKNFKTAGEQKRRMLLKEVEEIKRMLQVYEKALPTDKEINKATSFQDLINITESWTKREDVLIQGFANKHYVRLTEFGNLSPRSLLEEMNQNHKNYQVTNDSITFNEQYELSKEKLLRMLFIAKRRVARSYLEPFYTTQGVRLN